MATNLQPLDFEIVKTNGERYSDTLKDTAFHLWFHHARDKSRVLYDLTLDPVWRDIAGLLDGDPVPDARTIARWERGLDWAERARELMKAAAPLSIRSAALEIAYAQHPAAVNLSRIARGDDPRPHDKLTLDAAKHILSMGVGDSVVHLAKPTVTESIDMNADMTMEEIVAAERALSEKSSR